MNVIAEVAAGAPGGVSPWHCCAQEVRCELLRLLRDPVHVLLSILFPALFYLLFGVMLSGGGAAAQYTLAGYGVFGLIGTALFGVGMGVATEREQGLLRLRRALPAPPAAWLLAKMLATMVFVAAITLVLALLAVALGDVSLAWWQWALLLAVNLAGVLPFCALGLYIGSLAGANASIAVVNLLFLPMVFLSGLWLPLSMLPGLFDRLAPVWPAYHLGQIAFKVLGHDVGDPLWLHLLVLTVTTAAFSVLALRRLFARE